MVLYILRGVFIVVAASVTALYVLPFQETQEVEFHFVVLMLGGTVAIATGIVALDIFIRQKRLSALSGVFLGLIAGLLAAYAFSFVVDLIGLLTAPATIEEQEAYFKLLEGVKVLIGLVTCYLSIAMVLQTKDDFRFVIPYVEFAKQLRGNRPTVLDTSVIIDGRIVELLNTNLLQGTLVVPKFVLNELQVVADSSDKLRRARGRRGLDMLQKIQENETVDVTIDETPVEGAGVDQKLVGLAQTLQARIMTNDYNLAKIASLRGVTVINLNDLAKSLRPVALPGEGMHVRIVKPGESPSQGVGYLDDGTMVVVENARQHLNEEIELTVTSTLQTSAGRMIFGRYEGPSPAQRDRDEAAEADEQEQGEDKPQDDDTRPPSGPRRSVGRSPRRS